MWDSLGKAYWNTKYLKNWKTIRIHEFFKFEKVSSEYNNKKKFSYSKRNSFSKIGGKSRGFGFDIDKYAKK
jgi:hypothetical protein